MPVNSDVSLDVSPTFVIFAVWALHLVHWPVRRLALAVAVSHLFAWALLVG